MKHIAITEIIVGSSSVAITEAGDVALVLKAGDETFLIPLNLYSLERVRKALSHVEDRLLDKSSE